MMPRIVCLCGSTRFWQEFQQKGLKFTLDGEIVLSIGITAPDAFTFAHASDKEGKALKKKLDQLHFHKIDLADRVFILNVDGYIGPSTRRELAYSIATNKRVDFLNPSKGEKFMEDNRHELGRIVASFAVRP